MYRGRLDFNKYTTNACAEKNETKEKPPSNPFQTVQVNESNVLRCVVIIKSVTNAPTKKPVTMNAPLSATVDPVRLPRVSVSGYSPTETEGDRMLMGGWGTRYLISPLRGFSSAGVTRYSLRGVLGAVDTLEEGKGFSKAVGVTPF